MLAWVRGRLRMTKSESNIRAAIPSVVERTRPAKAAAAVVAAHFLGDTAVFVLGEEALLLLLPHGEARMVAAHAGAILCSAAQDERILTGGDDGTVVATGADGAVSTLATDGKRRWIDHVVSGLDRAFAWSAGKQIFVRSKENERTLEAPSTVGGLAFAPKGLRLAAAHYNGVTLWFPNARNEPEMLAWKGSHLAVTFSPDARFLVSSMQEPMLHGWRLSDRKDMRMSGYTARVRSFDFTADGKLLATSGANQLVLWPFQGKDGPMGKVPRMFAPAEFQIEAVACHPRQSIVAAGYADGLILLVRIEDGAEILARKGASAPITALAWNASGSALAFGAEDGEAGVVDLS
jgi:WD40 repeat protein